jgi:N-methylhydantoinase B/oxoprolinase/acetone carboxylase alpha subunit
MSKPEDTPETTDRAFKDVQPPIGWDDKTLQEMLRETEQQTAETGRYAGLDRLEMKEENPFKYEQLFSQLRGALVSARETAMHVSASPIVREIGELCFQVYTPEGDCVGLSTGIIVHVHTGSLAIKYMIEQDYEHGRGIQPGDVFCNNDNELGNVHTTDVHTIVPVFHDNELVAWVDGVTHQVDIGGMTRGHDQLASTTRYEDGLYATCEKIGEGDEIYQDWRDRGQRSVRTPMYWDLDEKCRLAGCHMVREAVMDMVDDVGADTFKQFMREAVEEGRQTLNSRVEERLFPGTYRDASFMPVPFEDEAWKPSAKQDMINHLPVEVRIGKDGGIEFDMEGASPPGPHPYNCAEGAMEGGLWVSLTQCLLHDGKVNDGSYIAVDTNYPEGSIVNPQDPSLSYHTSWGSLMPTYNAFWKNISRGFFARGFREEVVTGYSETGDPLQGGGKYEPTDEYFPVSPFEHSCQGLGASAVRDGLDHGYAMWNPESDMGDVEEWELIEWGLPYLSRQVKPDTAGHGKYRGGSGWEGIRVVQDSSDVSLYKHVVPGVGFTTSGMSGGYPNATNYSLRAHETDLEERIEKGKSYPTGDSPPGSFDEDIDGEIERSTKGLYFPEEYENYDLVHYQMGGGPGYGDPLDRPIEKVKEDVEEGFYTSDVVERVYGVVGTFDEDNREFTVDETATERAREELEAQRRRETVDFEEFYEEEREHVHEGDISDPTEWMYEGVFDISAEWANFFREYWDLDDDFTFEQE